MTNSEKAFEEWGEKIWLDGDRTALDFASSFNEEEAKKLCRFIWASAIEFAAKVCMEQPIGLVGTVQKIFAHQIRKQGAE